MRWKLNTTIFACIFWMILYFNCQYLQERYSIDQANAIEFWLMADVFYFAIIMFTEKHNWTWTLASFLFFSTTNNLIDEMWGNPLVYSFQEKVFLVASIFASFGIGFLTYKYEPKNKKHE